MLMIAPCIFAPEHRVSQLRSIRRARWSGPGALAPVRL
jgi:hypothetical protein